MKAVVIAAGRGTRMGPLTETRPKPLLPVAGEPILARVLDAAAPHVDGFVLVVGYRADDVRERFGDEHAGRPVEYATQADQLGTAHAIAQAEPHVDGPFLALNGDVHVTDELVASLAAESGTAVAVKPVDDPQSYGVVERSGGEVTGVVEKPADPPSNLANLGLYRFTPRVFDCIEGTARSERGEYEVTDSLSALMDHEPVTAVPYDGPWLDIGRPWELLAANDRVLSGLERDVRGRVEPNATLEGAVVVEEGARVRNGAHVTGPALVQSGAEVGPNAYVRGSTVVGEGAAVGHAVEVKNSVLMEGTSVSHLSYVGDSVLGADVNFGAGTTVANLRHDDETVRVRVKGEAVDTGRRKFGVVVGDGTRTAINTSLNAGVTLGTDARTEPGEAVLTDRNRD